MVLVVSINSDGCHGEEILDRQESKIAVLGDSFIFGYGVNQADIFSTVLEETGTGGTLKDDPVALEIFHNI
jgi:hypothetical protein